MATFTHSKDRRKQKCAFCNELLKHYGDIEVQSRNGLLFHIWCKQAIDIRRQKQRTGSCSDVYRNMNFIMVPQDKLFNIPANLLVYQ